MNNLTPDFQQIFENSPDLYLVLSKDFIIVAVSNAYLKATMTERSNILGRNLFDIFPDNPDDLVATGTSNLRASLSRVLKNKTLDTMNIQKYDIQKPVEAGGGFEERYWMPQNFPIINDDGEVSLIIHKATDVTTTARELKDANDQLDRFFSVSLDMLCIASGDGYFKLVNPAFKTVLGYTQKEMCSNSFLDFIHPDDIDKTTKEVEKQMLKGEQVLNFENRYRCKWGGYRILSWKSAPIGSLMYAAARDITDLVEAQKKIEILNKELEAFSYSASHDLKAPLRSIIGFSQVLLEDYGAEFSPQAKDNLSRVINAAQRMGQLIDGLLALSHLSSTNLSLGPVNLSSIAKVIFDELTNIETKRKLDFVIAHDIVVYGDESLLRAVISNLIQNSWKFSAKKNSVRIEFGECEIKGNKTFYVKDDGAGFDMKYVNKLFGPFQRLHSFVDFPGTGIGLATVQRIIHRHGGEIWAESTLDEGATFYFTLHG